MTGEKLVNAEDCAGLLAEARPVPRQPVVRIRPVSPTFRIRRDRALSSSSCFGFIIARLAGFCPGDAAPRAGAVFVGAPAASSASRSWALPGIPSCRSASTMSSHKRAICQPTE
jgi:hypothetical protein